MSEQTSNNTMVSLNSADPSDDLSDIFGEAPLIYDEDKADYLSLKSRLFGSVRPVGIVEQIWVYDILNLTWEAKRLRRLRAKLIKASSCEGVSQLLKPMVEAATRGNLVKQWALNNTEGVTEVNNLLEKAFLDQGSIDAFVLEVKIDTIERIEELIARTEGRRNAVLQEIERRREALARRMREAASIEDAAFSEIDCKHSEAAE